MAFRLTSSSRLSSILCAAILCVHFLLLPALTQAATIKDEITPEEIKKMELFAGDVMSCAEIPGMAIGVIRGNATFATGLGLADMNTAHPVGKTTTFNLGSTAKAFVPYVLAQILNNDEYNIGKRITFDSTLGDFQALLGDLEVPEGWQDLTLKDMLVYKSGSSAADMGTMAGLPSNITREDLTSRLRFLPKTKAFQQSNHHSNYLYTLAAHLAERLTTRAWKDLVQEFVLDKHGMDLTTFTPHGMTLEDVALPYRYRSHLDDPWVGQNNSLFDIHPSEPVGNIIAPPVDVNKWLRDLLHGFPLKGDNAGNIFRHLFSEWITVPENQHTTDHLHHETQKSVGFGMGWELSSYRGFQRFKYSGHLYAYSSHIWMFPEVTSAIFVSVNGPNSDQAERAIDGIMFHASDLILRQKPWMSSDMACCCEENYSYEDISVEATPAAQTVVNYQLPAEDYEGVYGNGLVGNVKIQKNIAGVLEMTLGRNVVGELLPGETENMLKFFAKVPLSHTREWETSKDIEFLPNAMGVFRVVRLRLNGDLSYDFESGKLFETMPLLADIQTTTVTTMSSVDTTNKDLTQENTSQEISSTKAVIKERTIEETDKHNVNTTLKSKEEIPSEDNDSSYVDTQPAVDNTDSSFQRDENERPGEKTYEVNLDPKSANSAQNKEKQIDLAAQVDESTTECFLNSASSCHNSLVTFLTLFTCVFFSLAGRR